MVEFHFSGDEEYVIPELTQRCLTGIDRIDADEFTSCVTRTRERITVGQFMDSELGQMYYASLEDGEQPIISLEGEERQEKIDDIEANTSQLIFLQVEISVDDGSDATVSMLVDDIELGYVEVWEFWEGEDTKGLLD